MPPVIVHAQGFVRSATAELLRDQGVPVLEVSDGGEAVDRLSEVPSAVLVCSEVPPIAAWARERRVVVLDGVSDDDVQGLLRRGAEVARPAGGTIAGLLEATLAPEGQAPVSPVLELRPRRRADAPTLTPRQLEVMQLIARGFTSHEIATSLGVRPKTVENYKQRVFARLGVQNRAHAVARCARLGLVGDGPVGTLAG